MNTKQRGQEATLRHSARGLRGKQQQHRLYGYLLIMQEDQALGYIQCHSRAILVPAEEALALGVAVLHDARMQVAPLHVL